MPRLVSVRLTSDATSTKDRTMADHYADSTAPGGGTGSYANPWNTITQINNHALAAGDAVYLKLGSNFRDGSLTAPSTATEISPITFGAYGTSGELPII